MTRSFTGWHMTVILVGFFGVVIAVNLVMASFAAATFGGTVVDNSYVASQNYNRWLEQADNQERLGWVPTTRLDQSRRLQLSVTKDSAPLADVSVIGIATHPLGRAQSVSLAFDPSGAGALQSRQTLPAGRWRVQLTLRQGADMLKLNTEVQ